MKGSALYAIRRGSASQPGTRIAGGPDLSFREAGVQTENEIV